jgi:hypothetical protein
MDNTMNACIAGNDQACAAFPAWQAQANRETQESANVAGIILLPLVLFGAAIASGPGGDGGPYVYGHSEYGHYGYGHGGCCFGGFHGGGFYGHH